MKVIDSIKTKNVIKIPSNETLSSVLSTLSSSHDAAFVFSEDDKFLGVINPYHSLIKTSNPGNARAENCLFRPPHIAVNFSIAKVAQLMIESKIHYLPVFDENETFIGIVSARNILTSFLDDPVFKVKIKDTLASKNQPLVTVYDDDLVSHAINVFKVNKVSKLVVVNKDMKLKGILTYYDLINFLITPKKKEHKGDRIGTRVSFNFQPVKKFAKTMVLTLNTKNMMSEALSLIIEKEIGSVVIIDGQKHPIGIITTRDFLNLLVREKGESKIEVATKNLSQESIRIVKGFVMQMNNLIKKLPNVAKAKMFIKEEKQGGLFEIVLSLIPKKGAPKIMKKEGKNLSKLLNVFKKIKRN